jgi:hypothetical protein
MKARNARILSILLLWAVGLVCPAPVRAETPAPRDEGEFFNEDTLKTAAERVKQLEEKYGVPVVIETYKAIPEERAKGVDLLDVQAREKFFGDWAQDLLQQAKLDGVGVLICKQPARLHIALGEKTRQTTVTARDRRGLVSMLAVRIGQRRNDDGLLQVLDNLEQIVQANRARPPTAQTSAIRDETGAGADAVPIPAMPHLARAGVGPGASRDAPPPVLQQPPEEAQPSLDAGTWLLLIGGAMLSLIIGLLLWRWWFPHTPSESGSAPVASMDA